MSSTEADVIVVGAGLSGLIAASEILHYDKTLKVLLLEASDRVGGKILTLETGNDFIELGAQNIQKDQKNMFQLLDSLGLSTFVVPPNEVENYSNCLVTKECMCFYLFYRLLARTQKERFGDL